MSNTNNANNVTAGKPKIGGAVYRAKKGYCTAYRRYNGSYRGV